MRFLKKHRMSTLVILLLMTGGLLLVGAQNEEPIEIAPTRQEAQKLMQEGNWKEAQERFEKLVLQAENNSGEKLAQDYNNAVNCLRQLGNRHELNAFLEKAVDRHAEDWRLLQAAAQSLMGAQHYGYLIAGEFHRGHHRGGGKRVSSQERDRVRALELMEQARPLAKQSNDKNPVAHFFLSYANYLLGNRGYSEAWRLQVLTDLNELPDYDEGRYGWGSSAGAPATPDGEPVFFKVPESFEKSINDGERWRWCLMMATEFEPSFEQSVLRQLAGFHWQQFGVQTLQSYQHFFGRSRGDDDDDLSETAARWQLDDLPEDETIAKLATGVTRIELPGDHNFILYYKRLAEEFRDANARERLAQIYENRRQYKTAAEQWRTCIKDHGPGHNNHRQKRLEQIVDNWGRFENTMTQPAGKGATIDYRFRNGKEVRFTAHEIDIEALLEDIKKYLKSNPDRIDWQKINIGNIGHMLFHQDQRKYIKDKAAEWNLDLEPRPNHYDKLITVGTPLQKAGAYALRAEMEDGNTSEIIIWISDTAIVKQRLDGEIMYFVADAVTGKPIEKANMEFVGYRQEHLGNRRPQGRQYNIHFANFARFTGENGLLYMKEKDLDRQYSWLAIARTDAGRLAYLGFNGVWYGRHHDADYNQTRTYLVTDRPVYRPTHKVEFKFWVRHAKYDMEDVSNHANKNFTVKIRNPRNEEVFSKQYTTDEWGGLSGTYELPDECPLGNYYIWIDGMGGGNFRVEEYKKPEFEVTVEAPDKPVMLGEEITAKIQAKYFFGEPVRNAKVKYKVQRYDHNARWYPVMPWDWFYGQGYWWFAYDYEWYPGWRKWGCARPVPFWWPTRRTPPELVAEATVPVGPEGTVEVKIDTELAKAMYGDTDHRYEITAEVTDESRRTIVGSGQVLVAQDPFKVYAWVDRGYYRVGDEINASFQARTLDGSPVEGDGELTLYRITYGDEGEPKEQEVQDWDLNTNNRGSASQKMQASKAGQYRLSYKVSDNAGHTMEGGYVFIIRGEGFDGRQFRFNQMEIVPDEAEYKPGDSVELALRTDQAGSTVLLFERPSNGVYLRPKVIHLEGKETVEDVMVTKKDMPNFFVEAFTISNGDVHRATREIVVPPEKRVLNVEVKPDKDTYLPGEEATFELKVTGLDGEPYAGSLVMTVYDRAVEYISGGSNVGDIKEFFWKWRRRHNPSGEHNLGRWFSNFNVGDGMGFLGVFGHLVAFEPDDALDSDMDRKDKSNFRGRELQSRRQLAGGMSVAKSAAAPMALGVAREGGMVMADAVMAEEAEAAPGGQGGGQEVEPTV
ncbi:MAG: MG2 domain-containing protein, partial [Candidatus Sumerlaeota bacterium]